MGFCDSLGIIFSFNSWQATHERKKPMPSPQPKGIKTIYSTFQLNVSGLTLAVEQNIPKKCASKDLTTACPDKAVRIIDKTR